MAENKTILELNEVTANASGDVFPLVQSGVTQKTTLSKIKTFFDSIYTTTSAVATQISNALSSYATQTYANSAASTAQSNAIASANGYTDTQVATKQPKQSTDVVSINAQGSPALTSANCILSIFNIPGGTGNKQITINAAGYLTDGDFVQLAVKYKGFDVNLRSYNIEGGSLHIYLNVHSSPTEPVIISMNKIN